MIRNPFLLHADQIDPISSIKFVIRNPSSRRPTQTPSFVRGRRHFGVESFAGFLRPRFHFGEHEDLILWIPSDDIEFIPADAHVASANLVSDGTEIRRGKVFAHKAESQVLGARPHARAGEEWKLHIVTLWRPPTNEMTSGAEKFEERL